MKETERNVIYNASNTRLGRMSLTTSSFLDMQRWGITGDELEETFRYGEEMKPGKIVFSYGNYEIGLFFVKDETRVWRGDVTQERFVIIACWRRGVRK